MEAQGRRARRAFGIAAALAIAAAGVPATSGAETATTPMPTESVVVQALSSPVTAIVPTPTGRGYWRATADGGVLVSGDAKSYGSARGKPHDRIVAMATTPTGRGYWLADRKGAVFAFGDAPRRGSLTGIRLNKPIVGMAGTPNGQGYWLVATDGGIFAFHAPFKGSTGSIRLNKPIVGMVATPQGTGYWMVASDGGVFAFDAPFVGSTGNRVLDSPIVGMAPRPSGAGYYLVAANGRIYRFPTTAAYYGSAYDACPGGAAAAVGTTHNASGYWVAFSDGRTYAFSPTSKPPVCGPVGDSKAAQMARDLLARVNAERTRRGLGTLRWDPTLGSYAQAWTAHMAQYGLNHSAIGDLLDRYSYIGENIAQGSYNTAVGGLHVAWMNSPGHRSNMLAPGFTRVGIGAYCSSGKGLVVLSEVFARPQSQGLPASMPTSAPPPTPIARPDAGTLTCTS